MEEYTKRFDEWNEVQKHLNERKKLFPFKKRDIWWASIGVNIGQEIDGKNSSFERPVLVIKKINATSAFVVPLTSTIREGDNRYVIYEVNGERRAAAIAQARRIDVRRFRRKFNYKLRNEDFIRILAAFRNQFPE